MMQYGKNKMINTEKRLIPSDILFSAISKELEENRKATFTVTGMSMYPLLCHGRDQVIVSTCQIEKLHVGDIVLFQTPENKYLLHRITQLKKETFISTGDGNFQKDGEFSLSCIIAQVTSIIRDGKRIECNGLKWNLFSYVWMFLFPIRKVMFKTWFHLRPYIKH